MMKLTTLTKVLSLLLALNLKSICIRSIPQNTLELQMEKHLLHNWGEITSKVPYLLGERA